MRLPVGRSRQRRTPLLLRPWLTPQNLNFRIKNWDRIQNLPIEFLERLVSPSILSVDWRFLLIFGLSLEVISGRTQNYLHKALARFDDHFAEFVASSFCLQHTVPAAHGD